MIKTRLVSPSQKRGKHYENLALRYLEKQGMSLLAKNFNCRCGEIDLIFKDQDSLAFVEVRFRKSLTHGSATETVHYFKQQKIIKTAQFFLLKHRLYEKQPCRFDVIGVNLNTKKNKVEFHWIKDAFQL